MQALQIHLDDITDVREESGRIVIEPVPATLRFGWLLKGITSNNRHESVDFGLPAGKGAW